MSKDAKPAKRGLPGPDFFDLAGSDPELLNSGRIPDPAPEHTPLFRWLARLLTAAEARLRARGDASVRNALRIGWAVIAAVGVLLLVGPIINKPLDFDDVIAAAKVDKVDWVARDASVDYAVTRGADGGFATTVSERYTADFRNGPEPSIERVLVTEFQGHDTEFALGQVTVDGAEVPAEVERESTTTAIRIAPPAGSQFSGTHEISVTYELGHLIKPDVDAATGAAVDEWNWPVFGQLWPQATRGIEVTVTLPSELDDALVRPPQAYVGWLILSATQWLEPEQLDARDGGGVRYSFSNDQSLPPYPDIVIRADFDADTFAQPDTTTLFWWQSYGPLLPLVILAVLALFAAAARRIVWADSAGKPWYLARSEPPKQLTPDLAAALLGKSRHAELVAELADPPGRKSGFGARERWYARLARSGRRAGRWGNAPVASAAANRWRRSNEVVELGLRWAPDSYVRDFFVLAPIAITLLQWGLLRQLSHHVILLVVWWPAVFVLVATVLAVVTLALASRPRPLTPEGALAVQDLKGIHVFARVTRLLDRGPLEDPVLPYAALFVSPRTAGKRVTELAIREADDASIARGWRGERFLSLPAILALAAACAVLAASIVTVSTLPPPYAPTEHFIEDASQLPGILATQTTGFDVRAELGRDASGAARLEVTERLTVLFEENSGRVPQFAREWPSAYLGQDLGFSFDSLQIDGEPVPVREITASQSRVVVTQLDQALAGAHEVELRYTLEHAAVDAGTSVGGGQQVRWAAWLDSWEDEYYTNPANPFDGEAPVRPLRVQLTVAPELASEIRHGGWIDSESEQPEIPNTDGNTVMPWRAEMTTTTDTGQRVELRIGSEQTLDDGALVVTFDADEVTSRETDALGEGGAFEVSPELNATLGKYELQIGGFTDLGARLDFPAGTFTGVEPGAAERFLTGYQRPFTMLMWGTGGLILVMLGVVTVAARRSRPPGRSIRLVALAALPVLALAQCVVFWWVIGSMPGGDGRGVGAFVLGGAMLVALLAEVFIVIRLANRRGGE